MLKALEDVSLGAVVLCPPVLTPLLVLNGCVEDCSDAVVARVLIVVIVEAWEDVCDGVVVLWPVLKVEDVWPGAVVLFSAVLTTRIS